MFIMKKLLSCLLAFCLLCGLGIYNINNSIPVKANDTNIEIINEPLKGEEFNHVFTQEELKGTEYEGKNVEVRDGVMYVKGPASTVYLTNGNICYRQSYNTYACKYSLRPDEDSD